MVWCVLEISLIIIFHVYTFYIKIELVYFKHLKNIKIDKTNKRVLQSL
jgi:hypothetical protein